RIGGSLTRELDVQRLVQTVTDEATALTRAQFGAFFYNVLNERGESYTLYTISGVPRENFSKFPMPRNTHVFDPTFRGAGTVRSDDITKDPRYGKNAPYYGMPEGHLPVRSYLAVPVMSRSGEVLGGLFFGHSRPGVFTARHEELLVGIAAQAAVAIDNARLYQAAQREIVERREAEERKDGRPERRANLQSAPPLARVAHAAQVVLGARAQLPREALGQPDALFKGLVEGRVEQAEQAALFEERGGAGGTFPRVALELFGGSRVQLAVEVGGGDARLRALRPRVGCAVGHKRQTPVMPRATRSSRIASRARKILFLTVPSGRPVTSAISS
nr:GAF domain-containing protein [Acidobacteriota bacterium]